MSGDTGKILSFMNNEKFLNEQTEDLFHVIEATFVIARQNFNGQNVPTKYSVIAFKAHGDIKPQAKEVIEKTKSYYNSHSGFIA